MLIVSRRKCPEAKSREMARGFSLIEVMVSVAILAAGLLALMSMQTGALRANFNNQNLIVAQHVAELAVEWVKTLSDTDLQVSTDIFPLTGADLSTGLDTQYQFTDLATRSTEPVPGILAPDFYRFIGTTVERAQDPKRSDLAREYVVRIGVEKDYRDTLSRCSATVYWEQDGELVSISVVFFVERKV